MKINCDIGERGHDHPVDRSLMELIDIANIACGGHAGDERSVKAFRELAETYHVDVSAHLSYPDRENFGRTTIDMSLADLLASLDEQYSLISDVKMVKFHGALYNDCAASSDLAATLADWLEEKGIARVITQFDSELAHACEARGVKVVAEAFAERRYALDEQTGKLSLVKRSLDYASIRELDAAVAHSVEIQKEQQVTGHIDDGKDVRKKKAPLIAETICIHSDSPISLELAGALKEALAQER